MAIKLIGSYSKKLGLPAYSSHSFAASVETEISDLSQAPEEVARLYRLLQQAVDREIRHSGFVPNGNGSHPVGSSDPELADRGKVWTCTDKQRRLILQLVREHEMDINTVQQRAYVRFGTGLRQLTRHQASELISSLLQDGDSLPDGPHNGRGDRHSPTGG